MLNRSCPIIATALALLLVLGSGVAANADPTASIAAAPGSIAVGGTSTITATNLGGLDTAYFGLDGTPGGSLSDGSSPGASSIQVSVADGTATAQFTASSPGTFTIAVGDGETPLATTTVAVMGALPVVGVTANPSSLTVGQTSTISATGLGGLDIANFGLDNTAGGSFSTGSGSGASSIQVSVVNATATAQFTANNAGTFTIAVGDGETALASTTITVTAAPTPTPTPTSTPTPTPTPTPGGNALAALAWVVGIVAVVLVAAAITIVVLVRRRARLSAGHDRTN